jgi:glycosyltransferase involved in cell wall biosynthesis
MAHIQDAEPLTRLVIVGGGPAEDALKRMARELGIAPRVHFVGYRPYAEMADIYAAADLFVFASRTETQGIVTVEAMASGTPVVAVSGPGTIDLLENERGGLLCPPDERAFANQVIRLLGDATLYAKKVAEAYERARMFSPVAMARHVLSAYESLLESAEG